MSGVGFSIQRRSIAAAGLASALSLAMPIAEAYTGRFCWICSTQFVAPMLFLGRALTDWILPHLSVDSPRLDIAVATFLGVVLSFITFYSLAFAVFVFASDREVYKRPGFYLHAAIGITMLGTGFFLSVLRGH